MTSKLLVNFCYFSNLLDTSRYICYYAASPAGTNKHSIGVAEASSPWGPYEDIGSPIVDLSFNCIACYIDPSYFMDPDTGRKYLLWKGDSVVNYKHIYMYCDCLDNDRMTSFQSEISLIQTMQVEAIKFV